MRDESVYVFARCLDDELILVHRPQVLPENRKQDESGGCSSGMDRVVANLRLLIENVGNDCEAETREKKKNADSVQFPLVVDSDASDVGDLIRNRPEANNALRDRHLFVAEHKGLFHPTTHQ